MKLNILSDLHLGQGALPWPRNDADVVILAGDIGRPAEAVAWSARLGKPVLYVPGNHEFYGGSIAETAAQMKALCAGTQVQVLDDDEVQLGGVRFLGSTLWTDFLLFGDGDGRAAAVEEGFRFMRDYQRIQVSEATGTLFTPLDAAALHQRHAAWLAHRLAQPHDGPTVVITHHAPSARSIHPRFAHSRLNACFVSDADALVAASGARLWVHGHTHDSFDYVIQDTRVLCNPRGYFHEGAQENAAFNPHLVVDIS
jgi:predicted phosphodiesterase